MGNGNGRYYRESVEGVAATLKRMCAAAGDPDGAYSEVLDVSQQTIEAWFRRGTVAPAFLEGFAAAYGVSLEYLRSGIGEARPAAEASSTSQLTADELRLVEGYRASSETVKRAALCLVGAAADPE